jgi:hypothetical protein
MSDGRESTTEIKYLGLMVGLAFFLFLWRAPFTASFWLDETITAWIVSDSLSSVWRRSIEFQGQSPLYYLLVWFMRQICGEHEIGLRALSVVCGGATCLVLVRTVQKLSADPSAPLLALALLVVSDGFQEAVLSARPYALAILFASSSLLVLLMLREKYSFARAIILGLLLTATFYAHYLFALVGVFHVLFLLVADRPLLMRLVPLLGMVVVACVPGLFQLRSLSERAASLSFVSLPTLYAQSLSEIPTVFVGWFLKIAKVAVPIVTVVPCTVAVVLALIWGGKMRVERRTRRWLVIVALYALLPALLFLLISYASPGVLFVARYWSWSLVPLSVGLTLLVCSIEGQRPRKIAFVTTLLFVLMRLLTQDRVIEEWRDAAAQAHRAPGRLILFSGLIEAEQQSQVPSGEYYEYLRAPLTVYGIKKQIDVVGLTAAEDLLRDLFRSGPFTLVAAHVQRSGERSPERFLQLTADLSESRSVTTHGRLVTVIEGRR